MKINYKICNDLSQGTHIILGYALGRLHTEETSFKKPIS